MREERYGDPLNNALVAENYGEVTGGGTMTEKSGEIEFCGLDVSLVNVMEGVPFIISLLESRGCAKGSIVEICDEDDEDDETRAPSVQRIPFGRNEGIGVYLDGVNLASEVYTTCDVNHVWSNFEELLDGEGEPRGHWQGPTETAIYLYGRSAARMRELIADFLASYPLCQGSRVMDITPTGEDWHLSARCQAS